MKKIAILFMLLIPAAGCEDLNDIISSPELTNEEIVKGLKTALEVSTDSSVKRLNAADGYYKDQLVKILLPPEADVIFQNISKIPGGSALMENTILAINRAAEDAAIEAKPIFINAITGMTFTDALSILKGNDSAATSYLQDATYSDLVAAFAPKITTSLSKPVVGGNSAESLYSSLVNSYNQVANASFGLLKPITSNSLGEYTTTKALDGLFRKIKDEEAKIRENTSHQVNDILQKVFKK